jgi:hypothetical protein
VLIRFLFRLRRLGVNPVIQRLSLKYDFDEWVDDPDIGTPKRAHENRCAQNRDQRGAESERVADSPQEVVHQVPSMD